MALMPGGDLKARIRANPEGMPAAEARAVAAAVARALDYAHRRGVVHRDVKPENILFGEEGTPQLTDFGIARAMTEGTRMTATGMSIGSPHYMSPEQARDLKVDGRSDLYSLGVVLYEMLTGQLPFQASDTFAVAYSHIHDPGAGSAASAFRLAAGAGPAAGQAAGGSLCQRRRTGRGAGCRGATQGGGHPSDAVGARG